MTKKMDTVTQRIESDGIARTDELEALMGTKLEEAAASKKHSDEI